MKSNKWESRSGPAQKVESAERHGTVRGPAHPEVVSCAGTPESQRRHARAVQGGPSGAMGGIAGICADAGHAIRKTSEELVTCLPARFKNPLKREFLSVSGRLT